MSTKTNWTLIHTQTNKHVPELVVVRVAKAQNHVSEASEQVLRLRAALDKAPEPLGVLRGVTVASGAAQNHRESGLVQRRVELLTSGRHTKV